MKKFSAISLMGIAVISISIVTLAVIGVFMLRPGDTRVKEKGSFAKAHFVQGSQVLPGKKGPAVKSSAEERLSDLMLIGTMLDKDGFSVAFIRNCLAGYEGQYREGDRIWEFTISRILHGEVVLKSKDGREYLITTSALQKDTPINHPDIIEQEEYKTIVKKHPLISNYKNLNNLLKDVTLRPDISSGRIEGIRLEKIRDGSVIKDAGFKEGDVVKGINRCGLQNLKDVEEVYRQLIERMRIGAKFQVDVTVQRDGKLKTLAYDVVE